MAPSLTQRFSSFNASSDADNEESIFSNSKVSSLPKFKEKCDCNVDDSDKTDAPDISRDDTNLSVLADATIRSTDVEGRCFSLDHISDYICPPPLLPANVCINSECLCPQMATLVHAGVSNMGPSFARDVRVPRGATSERRFVSGEKDDRTAKECQVVRSSVMNWLKNIVSGYNHKYDKNNCEYYKMDVKRSRKDDKSPPRRVIFELVDANLPKKDKHKVRESTTKGDKGSYFTSKERRSQTYAFDHDRYMHENLQKIPCREDEYFETDKTDTCCEKAPFDFKKTAGKTTYLDTQGKTRVDVYYFDHGNSTHFQTTDYPPLVCTEALSEKTEKQATKFWAEIFGTVHIGFSFCTSFALQLFRFVLYSILRPLTIGLMQLSSDYFFKPFLATLFNGIIQPILIFFYNVATSVKDLCHPLAEGVGYFMREFSVLLRAIRIVEVNTGGCESNPHCKCEKIKVGKKSKVNC
ncbi:uncharacterized protein LOC132705107 [Cylas formicarius]|uniref:uncharacterized protein LOC132705107 n=1 Tax=Cylas formicarius TaxID=197179 RepID=UPI0029584F13|nr:uncharacterized protein LOC132705107 [Cylas formicarius]